MREFRLILLISISLLTAACGDRHDAPTVLGTGELRWASFPIEIQVDSQILADTNASNDLLEAIAFWESLAGKALFRLSSAESGLQPFLGSPDHPESISANGIFFLSSWPFDAKIAGRTITLSSGAIISSSAILLNPDTTLCPGDCASTEELRETSRRRLLTHELGHFLGLSHVSNTKNIMYPEILPGGTLEGMEVDIDIFRKLTN